MKITIRQLKSLIGECLSESMSDERYQHLKNNTDDRYMLSNAEYEEYLVKDKEEQAKDIYNKYVRNYEQNWDAVLAYFQGLGFTNPDRLAQEKEYFITYNEFGESRPVKSLTMIEEFVISGSRVVVTDTVKANKETGQITNENVRFVFSGVTLSPEIQNVVNKVTGKTLKFHRPTKSWVYDSGIDGKIQSGDPRLDVIAKNLISVLSAMQ